MCIRDRFKKICRNAGVERWPHRKLKSLTSKLEDLKQRLGHENRGKGEAELRAKLDELRCLDVDLGEDSPVSYTHLRAHETPEHLVCRLLLEKKKKKNKHVL
eukprot:TRINITY_DN4099_c0_g1_i2.p1 TRINITY_DN4099_c0_g1~~TRINITY_DN4099_c0_g1_i2.p1  ORF type:complete len:102 (-),score=36.65 TRINITY_DN4099_c0_g1_i2:41-346(-)